MSGEIYSNWSFTQPGLPGYPTGLPQAPEGMWEFADMYNAAQTILEPVVESGENLIDAVLTLGSVMPQAYPSFSDPAQPNNFTFPDFGEPQFLPE